MRRDGQPRKGRFEPGSGSLPRRIKIPGLKRSRSESILRLLERVRGGREMVRMSMGRGRTRGPSPRAVGRTKSISSLWKKVKVRMRELEV